MKKITHAMVLALLLITIINETFAQKPPAKFGKISSEHLESTICPIDSNAHAYFIFDFGKTSFKYATTTVRQDEAGGNKGFQMHYTRHFRIKILDKQAFNWGDIEIALYRDVDEERITGIKAVTYNLENGKLVKSKLDKKNVLKEETSKYWTTTKFAMPNVKEGSIVEVSYSIVSDFFFNLQPWSFQKTIPVLQSEYHAYMPEYFRYNVTHKGYYPLKTERDRINRSISITYVAKNNSYTSTNTKSTSTLDYYDNIVRTFANNIPAFPVEKHLRTLDNYLSKIEFELNQIQYPNSPVKNYTTTWEDINKNLILSYSFGKELNRKNHLKNDVSTLTEKGYTDIVLMDAAYEKIKQKIKWNGIQSKYVKESLPKAYKDGAGNTADVNLNLVVLLRELGFESYPVILSTQNHGIIHPAHPSVSRFNYVIAMVRHEDKTYLLDATDPLAEINILPTRCLNDKGRIVRDNGGSWINLMNWAPYNLVDVNKVAFDNNLEIKGEHVQKLKDYAAYSYKKKFSNYNNQVADMEKALNEKNEDFSIQNMQVKGIDSLVNEVFVNYDYKLEDYVDNSSDIVLFKPVLNPYITENPFKLEKREYPVEFDYPQSVKQVYSFAIPENYEIVDLPKTIAYGLPDKSGIFRYSIQKMGNTINLVTDFKLKKTIYLPAEYEAIKGFYQNILDKQNELIVLKPIG